MAKLVVKFQDVIIKEHPLDKDSVTIGRKEENDLCLDNMAISGHHARIDRTKDIYTLVDLKSTNGTFVNGKRVASAVLKPNDWINIGKHILYFKQG